MEVAKAVRGGGADQCAEVVVKVDLHAQDAGLAFILTTIAIQIAPDILADAAERRDIARVDGGQVLCHGQ